MQISPDGKYVLYDAVNPETGKLLLYLHTVSEQTTRELMEFPNPSPYLELNFIWTQNGSSQGIALRIVFIFGILLI